MSTANDCWVAIFVSSFFMKSPTRDFRSALDPMAFTKPFPPRLSLFLVGRRGVWKILARVSQTTIEVIYGLEAKLYYGSMLGITIGGEINTND